MKPWTYYNDHEPEVCEWLRELMKAGQIPEGEVDERSILEIDASELAGFRQCHFFAGIGGWALALDIAGVSRDRNVWTGSPPCQPFSSSGLRLARNDPRHLAPKFAELVRAGRPAVLYGEQVASADAIGPTPGSSVGAHTGRPQWAWVDDLSDRLEAARYAVGAADIPAAGVGAPCIRQRTFFGAIRLEGTGGGGQHWRRHPDADREGGDAIAARGPGAPLWLAVADSERGRGGQPRSGDAGDARVAGETRLAAAPDSFWGAVDWLGCTDGSWRPVEPGTFPLASRLPGRVGLLRGYGNAINPWAAAAFVAAFEATIEGERR